MDCYFWGPSTEPPTLKSVLKLTIFSPDFNIHIYVTDIIFTDMIVHAKASSVRVMYVIIMSDNVGKWCKSLVPCLVNLGYKSCYSI